MSLCNGADIWSMEEFTAGESTLKDLLDCGNFTLEQLLNEDELLQELKGLHPSLVNFLCKPEICRELLDYLTCNSDQKPLTEEDDLNLNLRYPYMACEIICCEVNQIIDTLTDGYVDDENIIDEISLGAQEFDSTESHNGSLDGTGNHPNGNKNLDLKQGRIRLLDSLFDLSLLVSKKEVNEDTNETTLDVLQESGYVVDDRLAGYLEKVLSTLIKLRPATISTYLNTHGSRLLPIFFHHVSSYSVMQILQRILIPTDNNESNTNHQIDINLSPCTPNLITRTWIDEDVTLRLLLQQIISPNSTHNLKSLDEVNHCKELLIALLQSPNSPLERLLEPEYFSEILSQLHLIPEPFTPHESRMTHVLHIFEAMLLQLGGYGMHTVPSRRMKLSIMPSLPKIIELLRCILDHPEAKTWKRQCQLKWEMSICGIPRLRCVRVLEALVLLGEEEIDEILTAEDNGAGDIIGLACDLLWEMEWCSGLHQSVANMIVHVLEGKNRRYHIQNYLINKYDLLKKLMNIFEKNEEIRNKNRLRLGYMGHIIIMCQSLDHIEKSNYTKGDNEEETCQNAGNIDHDKISEGDNKDEIHETSQKIHKISLDDQESSHDNQCSVECISPTRNDGDQDDIDVSSFTLVGQAAATPLPRENIDEVNSIVKQNLVRLDSYKSSITTTSELTTSSTHTSSRLLCYIQSHSAYDQWSIFLTTTLAKIGDVQSKPLGGSIMDQTTTSDDILGQHNAFSVFNGNDHDLLGSGEVGEASLDITENELDIAASMMEAFSERNRTMESLPGSTMNSSLDHIPGGVNGDYFFDDPLGRRHDHDNFGIDEESKGNFLQDKNEDDGDDDMNDDDDVQVLDLFVQYNDLDVRNPSIENREDKEKTEMSKEFKDSHEVKEDYKNKDCQDDTETSDSLYFADFESFPVDQNDDVTPALSELNEPQEDFFANFKDISHVNATTQSNDEADYFFDADFSSFEPGSAEMETFNKDENVESSFAALVDNDNKEVQRKCQSSSNSSPANSDKNDKELFVGDLFSDTNMKYYQENGDETAVDRPEEDDPFEDFDRRRPRIDELF